MTIKMILYTNPKKERRVCFYNSDKYSDLEIQKLIENGESKDSVEIIDILFESMDFLGKVFECIVTNSDLSENNTKKEEKIAIDFTEDKYIN